MWGGRLRAARASKPYLHSEGAASSIHPPEIQPYKIPIQNFCVISSSAMGCWSSSAESSGSTLGIGQLLFHRHQSGIGLFSKCNVKHHEQLLRILRTTQLSSWWKDYWDHISNCLVVLIAALAHRWWYVSRWYPTIEPRCEKVLQEGRPYSSNVTVRIWELPE